MTTKTALPIIVATIIDPAIQFSCLILTYDNGGHGNDGGVAAVILVAIVAMERKGGWEWGGDTCSFSEYSLGDLEGVPPP
jgi:hypothetical protein